MALLLFPFSENCPFCKYVSPFKNTSCAKIFGISVKLYQGVTLGALSTKGGQKLRDVRRHPTIGDNVTIFSGASILGGETVIEEGVVIGGNSFITQSIKKGTKVSVRNQELIYHSDDESLHHKEQDESWFYSI